MTTDFRALCAGYEPGDGSMDGAMLVDGEWWHPMFGCDSLQMVVDRAARRPKSPSLKEQALKELEWVDKNLKMPLLNQCTAIHTIRCALEQLDD